MSPIFSRQYPAGQELLVSFLRIFFILFFLGPVSLLVLGIIFCIFLVVAYFGWKLWIWLLPEQLGKVFLWKKTNTCWVLSGTSNPAHCSLKSGKCDNNIFRIICFIFGWMWHWYFITVLLQNALEVWLLHLQINWFNEFVVRLIVCSLFKGILYDLYAEVVHIEVSDSIGILNILLVVNSVIL